MNQNQFGEETRESWAEAQGEIESNARLFTPRHAATGERLEMRLSPTEGEHPGRGKWARILCDDKGQLWLAWGAPCGARCHCDAEAIPVREIDTAPADVRYRFNEAIQGN